MSDCKHGLKPGLCVIEWCEHWDGLPTPRSSDYGETDKYEQHRERFRCEPVLFVVSEP